MKKFTLILLILLSANIYSQAEYYTTDGRKIVSKETINEMITKMKTKFSKIFDKEMFVNLVITETYKSHDSVIHKVTFDIKDKKTVEASKNNPFLKFKNKSFPKFNLETLKGVKFNSESLKGKPTMINFWFTKCAPCIDEMPMLNKIAEKYKDKFNFIAITYESKKDVEQFLIKHPFKFKHLVNAKSFTDNIIGINSYPANLILSDKNILLNIKGGISYIFDDKGSFKMGEGNEIIKILEDIKN